MIPYKEEGKDLIWLGFKKQLIDDPLEVASLINDPLSFNAKLTELAPQRCFLVVQRSACTSLDVQHTAHVFAMKVCPVVKFWLFRDNIEGWAKTVEYDADGLSKRSSLFFNTMLDRVTGMAIYWCEPMRLLKEQGKTKAKNHYL